MKIDDELQNIIDKSAIQAAENAAGFYYEKTKDDIALMLEATDAIQEKFNDLVTKDEFHDLRADVKTIKLAVKDTNKDLSRTRARVTRLEKTVYNA